MAVAALLPPPGLVLTNPVNMPLPSRPGANLALFALMSALWGASWIAIKAAASVAPPVFVSAVRFAAVALILSLMTRGIAKAFTGSWAGRVVLTGLLVNTGTSAFLFWGVAHVPSGMAGLVNLPLVAVFLYGLAILFGEERPTWRHALALLLGCLGLVVLLYGKADLGGHVMELWGTLAIVSATFCYCLGSILSRPLLATFSPFQLTAAHAIVGALGLALLAPVTGLPTSAELAALLQPAPLTGLAFLVLFSTIVGYTIYLRLVRDWGAPRAGLYAFTSPVIALLLGALAYGEPLGLREAAAAVLLLSAAGIAIRPFRRS